MRQGSTGVYLFSNRRSQFLLLLSFMAFFGVAAILLGQDTNWDLRSYHFYNGYAFLHHRMGWDAAPAGEQSFLNPFFDVINYLLISTQKPLMVSFWLGLISGINCFIVYKISLLFFQDLVESQQLRYTLFSVLIGATSAGGIGLIGTTTNDTKMALLILLSFYYLLKAMTEGASSRQLSKLLFAGFLMGLDVGLKLVAACYGIGMIVALVFFKRWRRQHIRWCGLFILSMAAGFLLSDGYWMYFLYSHFQNPLFPYYNNIFHSPYAAYASYSDLKYYPQHYLTLPFLLGEYNKLISDVPICELRFAVLYSLAFIVMLRQVIFQKKLPRLVNGKAPVLQTAFHLLAIFYLASYLLWFFEFTIYRYLLPLELLSGLLMVCLIRIVFQSERYRLGSLIGASLVFIFTTYPFSWDRVEISEQYFEVTAPLLPKNSTIIFTALPLAYTIPFFQKDVRFVGMPFFVKDARLTGAANWITSGRHNKLQTEWVDPQLREGSGRRLYSLSYKGYSTNISTVSESFRSNYVLSRTSRQLPWKFFRMVTRGKDMVLEEYGLDEVPALKKLIESFPIDRVSAQLSREEQAAVETVMDHYIKTGYFQDDYDLVTRSLLYQYGLIREKRECVFFSTITDKTLELCPLKRIKAS